VRQHRAVIRLVFLLRRQSNLSLDDFHARWRDDHGPLVASHQTRLGIQRYTQSHRLDDPLNDVMAAARGAMEPAYDGVAELWWESPAALAAASSTTDGRRAGAELLADEAEFIDLPQSPLWLAYEYPQVNPLPEGTVARVKSPIVKLHFPLRHPPSMTMDEAQLYWRTGHGPLIRSMATATGTIRYQQVHRFESPFEAALREARGTTVESYTGHAEAWFDRTRRGTSPEAKEAGRRAIEDEAHFIDFARSAIWIGKEHLLIDRW
jgi:hypothetical protein